VYGIGLGTTGHTILITISGAISQGLVPSNGTGIQTIRNGDYVVKKLDDTPDLEFIRRLLEIYSLSEILEFAELEEDEALELLVQYGAVDFDSIPV
jgi:hypothetical protein